MRVGFRFGTTVASKMTVILAIRTKMAFCKANNEQKQVFLDVV